MKHKKNTPSFPSYDNLFKIYFYLYLSHNINYYHDFFLFFIESLKVFFHFLSILFPKRTFEEQVIVHGNNNMCFKIKNK